MSDVSQLRDLDRRRNEVRQFLRGGAPQEWFINNKLLGGGITEKAFALFYLGHCPLEGLGTSLDQAAVAKVTKELEQILKRQQKQIAECPEQSSTNTSLGVLPNSYASAVLVAGYLKIANNIAIIQSSGMAEPKELNEIERAVDTAIGWLTGQIIKPDGFIPSLYAGANPTPSSYLTFWCAAAIGQWQQYRKVRNFSVGDLYNDSLFLLISWSRRRLRDMIAFHHGSLRPQFDIIEVVYASATLLLSNTASDDRILVQHALQMLFESYFNSGCFKASAPVFTDVTNESVQISTAEALATIFLADRTGSSMAAHLDYVKDTYEWLRDHGEPVKGWYAEGQGRANVPNTYATASATLVLAEYCRVLDDCLDQKVRMELGISPFVQDSRLGGVAFPGDLDPLFKQTVFDPILKDKPNIASYSMVLYGPPGTSKTTIAKLIAQRLEWPLLKLDAGTFTHNGRTGIDQAATEVFEALKYLRGVVVLFDEVEELVGSREAPQSSMESRLLTTAMLPRLQDLRDRRGIVFILATNRVESIDTAITRLGRFDIVRGVLPPSQPERQRLLAKLICDYNLTEEVKRYISDLQIAEECERFCYGDLDAFVRELAIGLAAGNCTKDAVRSAFKHAQSRAITESDLKPYIDSMKKFDRPGRRTS